MKMADVAHFTIDFEYCFCGIETLQPVIKLDATNIEDSDVTSAPSYDRLKASSASDFVRSLNR
jgi:hypothetical protein